MSKKQLEVAVLVLAAIFSLVWIQNAGADGRPEKNKRNSEVQAALQQISVAATRARLTMGNEPYSEVIRKGTEAEILDFLIGHGLRPAFGVGLKIIKIEPQTRDVAEFIALAAYNDLDQGVYQVKVSDQSPGVWSYDKRELGYAYDGELTLYDWNLSNPAGRRITGAQTGLRYDPQTGLVISAAP